MKGPEAVTLALERLDAASRIHLYVGPFRQDLRAMATACKHALSEDVNHYPSLEDNIFQQQCHRHLLLQLPECQELAISGDCKKRLKKGVGRNMTICGQRNAPLTSLNSSIQ